MAVEHVHIVGEDHIESLIENGDRRALRAVVRKYRRIRRALEQTGDKIVIVAEPFFWDDAGAPQSRLIMRLGNVAKRAQILPADSRVLARINADGADLIKEANKTGAAPLERIWSQEFLKTADIRSEIMAKNVVKAVNLVEKLPELKSVRRVVVVTGAYHAPEIAGHLIRVWGERIGKNIIIHKNGADAKSISIRGGGKITIHIHDATADGKLARMFAQ